ncbi:FG-GAP repeat domain-containing protein [Streptomyces sp. NPDC058671]|uniref:FG-GAP repeat domain-containing protein n=1 Tax=Streptomyces sp. NPDC058671 TaxID=3346590 RepID=UPI0036614977
MRTASSYRRLVIPVGVVLAAVTTASLTAPAATAAPAPAAAALTAVRAAPIQVPFLASGGSLIGAGTTGFLTRDADDVVRWTRYADGDSKVIRAPGSPSGPPDGVLWTYLGKGDGTFAPRTRIGGGWQVYADIVGIGDGNKDGRPDVYARTPAGATYFYPGTGDYNVPFAPRSATGTGVAPAETAYNQLF